MRDHILQIAGDLFYSQGVRSVGVDKIIASAKIAKATLYRHFRSKDDIVLAYLVDRRARLENGLRRKLADADTSPTSRVLAVFDALGDNLRERGYRGCAFLMAMAEHGGSAAVRDAARSYKGFMRDQLFELVDGHFDDPHEIAEQLALLCEGAIATAAIRPDSEPAARARRCAELLLRAGQPA